MNLQKAMDTPTSQELPAESWLTRSLPSAAALSLPLGLEKHLTPLQFPKLTETGDQLVPLFSLPGDPLSKCTQPLILIELVASLYQVEASQTRCVCER